MLNDDLLERTNALAYFKDGGIDAYEMDGSIFIRVLDMEIQISTAEIGYRSDLYMEREEEDEDEEELSPCCGATLTWGDLCSECKEHT